MDANKKNKQNKGNQDYYNLITESLSDVKWVLDIEEMKFVFVNQASVSLRGFSPEEIIQQDAKNSFQSKSNNFLEKILPQRLAQFNETNISKKYTDEFQQSCKNGSSIWVKVVSFIAINPVTKRVELVGISRNVNAKKQAEKQAEFEQFRSNLFVKNAPLAIIEWDVNQTILAWNPTAENTFGYSTNEAVGMNFFELLIPEYEVNEIQKVVDELLVLKKQNYNINTNLTKSGETIKCEWYNVPLYDNKGEFISIVSMAKDITLFENIRNEKDKSNKNYHQLISELHEGVCFVNLKNEFVSVNPAFEKLCGFSSSEIIGSGLSKYIIEGNNESLNDTARLKTKNNKNKVIQISSSPWRDNVGTEIGSILFIVDITKQKLANESLKKRYNIEKRIFNISLRFVGTKNFSNIVHDSLEDIAMICHAESVFVAQFNHESDLCEVHSIWNKKNAPEGSFFNNCSLQQLKWGIAQLSKQDHLYVKNMANLPSSSEPLKTMLISNNIKSFIAFPIYIGMELYGFLGIQNMLNQDWSSNEFILLRSAGELLCNSIQRKFNEDRIKNLNKKLGAKTKEIEQVLYITSHDIRSPLVNILGFAKELSKSIDELKEYLKTESLSEASMEGINYIMNEDIPEILHFINAGGNKIDKLLNGLLKLSRLGRTPIEMEYLDSTEIIEAIIHSLGYQIEIGKITLNVSKLPKLNTDRNLFTQIMTNLIGNAIKYLDEERAGVINISAFEDEKQIIFKVEDNGIGIPEDKHDSIFEIFSRLRPEHAEGEGIGLTAIKKAVERLNGLITVESNEPFGCTFTVTFMNK